MPYSNSTFFEELEELEEIIDGLVLCVVDSHFLASSSPSQTNHITKLEEKILELDPFYDIPHLVEGIQLSDHQQKGHEWMREKELSDEKDRYGINGGVIVWKMGLGKTLLSLYHIFQMQKEQREDFPTLVICSKTLLSEWEDQLKRFYPEARFLLFHKEMMGKVEYENIQASEMRSYGIVITTYDVVMNIYRKRDQQHTSRMEKKKGPIEHRSRPDFCAESVSEVAFFDMPWTRIIADESQRFSVPTTKTFKAMMSLYAKYKFCLSGTPVKNYQTDLWSQFRFCGFTAISQCYKWQGIYDYKKYRLERFMDVRDYEDIDIQLPEKIVHNYEVRMSEKQLELYLAYLLHLESELASSTTNLMALLAVFTRLRQTCVAPYTIVRPKNNGGNLNDDLMKQIKSITSADAKWLTDKRGNAGFLSPKTEKIVSILNEIPEKEKVLVFSMFTSCLKTVQEALEEKYPETKSLYIDGSIKSNERRSTLEQFKESETHNILFMNYKVGGEGLNLVEATHVVCIEPWWTYAVHDQAIARAWRRGQTKPVHVYWVQVKNSIEGEIQKMCFNKHSMCRSYTHGETFTKKDTMLNRNGLSRLVKGALRHYNWDN